MCRKIFLLICCILLPVRMFAQSILCIGKSDTIYSAALNEERTYWLHLPPSYNDSAAISYPVIYLLDGDLFFNVLVAVQHSYGNGRQPLMPECIIVGVLNTDRTRDFTPSKSAFRRDGKRYDGDKVFGGESERFTDFLCGELRSKIDGAYRTSGNNSIVGHSFGGLFVLTTLFRHPKLFDAYVALDPSFWWDNGIINRMAGELIEKQSFENKKLYVGIAAQMRQNVNNIHWQVADDFQHTLIPSAIKNGLQTKWKAFDEESHGTIPIPGMADAFKTLFK
jgi:predicted alpha/beta superfamily hydrolase